MFSNSIYRSRRHVVFKYEEIFFLIKSYFNGDCQFEALLGKFCCLFYFNEQVLFWNTFKNVCWPRRQIVNWNFSWQPAKLKVLKSFNKNISTSALCVSDVIKLCLTSSPFTCRIISKYQVITVPVYLETHKYVNSPLFILIFATKIAN